MERIKPNEMQVLHRAWTQTEFLSWVVDGAPGDDPVRVEVTQAAQLLDQVIDMLQEAPK